MPVVPETQFALLGDDRIAYQVFGHGPPDLLWMSASADCIDARWEYPRYATFLQHLASFSRVIVFDRRGIGASDPVVLDALPGWEEWADDALAVMDAAGSERAAIYGPADAGSPALLFAAAHPDRSSALILANAYARIAADADYPDGVDPSALEGAVDWILRKWGTESFVELDPFYGEAAKDREFRRWLAKSLRMSCSPREAVTYFRYANGLDARHALPAIRVPTLVLYQNVVPIVGLSRYLAEHIQGAQLVGVSGDNTVIYLDSKGEVVTAIAKFLTGAPLNIDADRALKGLLFTDIVDSTRQAVVLGDRRWREMMDAHHAVNRTVIERHRGRVVRNTGDGVLATFDGPGKAVRCAFALLEALGPLGIQIRVGLHAGEVELRGDEIEGTGVHVAARVLEKAGPGEIFTSAAVPLLVAGSGLEFEERGEYELKGLPGTWKLYSMKS